jgi:hypothetical protein
VASRAGPKVVVVVVAKIISLTEINILSLRQ